MSRVKDNENESFLNSLKTMVSEGNEIADAIKDMKTIDIFIYSQICSRKSAERKATLKLLTGREWAKQLHEWSEIDNVFITKYEAKEES